MAGDIISEAPLSIIVFKYLAWAFATGFAFMCYLTLVFIRKILKNQEKRDTVMAEHIADFQKKNTDLEEKVKSIQSQVDEYIKAANSDKVTIGSELQTIRKFLRSVDKRLYRQDLRQSGKEVTDDGYKPLDVDDENSEFTPNMRKGGKFTRDAFVEGLRVFLEQDGLFKSKIGGGDD